MPFFKDLRRRSRAPASVRTSDSSNESNATVPTAKSSSTLNSSVGATTPPPSIKPNGSSSNIIALRSNGDITGSPTSALRPNGEFSTSPAPARPSILSVHSNRTSMMGLSPTGSNGTGQSPIPTSPYAPKVTSVVDGTVVYQKVLHIYGEIQDPLQRPMDGNLTVHHDKDDQRFPATNWPVSDSYFKALVHLSPGWNKLRLDFTSPKLASKESLGGIHSSFLTLNYLPLNNCEPLQLVVIAGKDSPGTFDAAPDRVEREGNDLALAVRKFRMAAHLWQAFTAEQMHRNNMGRRCFRLEEEWQTGTLSIKDWETGRMRNEAKVHIVRTQQTVAELRELQYAQQYGPASQKSELYNIASNAIKQHFQLRPGQKQYVAALLLDAHWDSKVGTVTGHAALGGTSDDLQLAIFGSHALQSYPSCLEEVVPAFMDSTKTDTAYVANDCNESGSSWEAANIGIGAHMHEVGHLFGCPHQESGVMLRGYVNLNRTFMVKEPYCTRTKSDGLRLCRIEDECSWHRLDVLRFRHHPCFRLPNDEPIPSSDGSIQFYPVGNGKILFISPSGVSFIEIYVEGEDLCRHHLEFLKSDTKTSVIPRQVSVTEAELRSQLPEDKKKKPLRLQVFSGSSRSLTVDDVNEVLSKSYIVDLPLRRQAPRRDDGGMTMNAYDNLMGLGRSFETRQGFRSKKLGFSQQEGSKPQQIILDSAILGTKLLTSIKVYSGFALDGVEFCYEDGHSQLFGKRGGKPGGDEFLFDTRRGETLFGFYVRAGLWIDGLGILTSSGRKSAVFGNANGGSGHTLIAPRGFSIAGVSGSCGRWVDGFQIIITR